MRFYFFLLTLFLLCSCERKSPEQRNLENYLQKTQEYAKNSNIQKLTGDKAVIFWKKEIEKTEDNENALKAFICYEIAVNSFQNDVETGKEFINKAKNYVDKEKKWYLQLKAKIYNGMANILIGENKIYQAAYYYNKAFAVLSIEERKQIEPLVAGAILINSAELNAQIYRYSKSREQSLLAIQLLKNRNLKTDYLLRSYINLLNYHIDRTGNKDSIKYYKKEMLAENRRVNPDEQLFTLNSVDYSLTKYYEFFRERDSAILCGMKLHEATKEALIKDKFNENILVRSFAMSKYLLSRQFIAKNMFSEGEKFISEADTLLAKHPEDNNDFLAIEGLKSKIMLYKNKGDFKNLEKQSELLSGVYGKIVTEVNEESLDETQALYDIELRNKSIENLNDEIGLTNARLKTSYLIISLSVLSIIFLLLLMLFFRNIQKQRQLSKEKETLLLKQRLLTTQMDPHFIFNTLTSLQSLIMQHDENKALKFLSSFSTFLRKNLNISRAKTHNLKDEIDLLENYLQLQQMKHQNFDFEINYSQNLEDELENIFIIPMLIQPFVENSILHGFRNINYRGKVSVNFLESNELQNSLTVEIADNGTGFLHSENNERKSHATDIVKERLEILKVLTAQQPEFAIEFLQPHGTKVQLVIPVDWE